MTRTITYYFTSSSPWTHIGHEPFLEVVGRHALKVEYRPMPVPEVFARTGGLPLGQRPKQRQRYRLLELQRWRGSARHDLQPSSPDSSPSIPASPTGA